MATGVVPGARDNGKRHLSSPQTRSEYSHLNSALTPRRKGTSSETGSGGLETNIREYGTLADAPPSLLGARQRATTDLGIREGLRHS